MSHRWAKNKMLTPAQQRLQTGLYLSFSLSIITGSINTHAEEPSAPSARSSLVNTPLVHSSHALQRHHLWRPWVCNNQTCCGHVGKHGLRMQGRCPCGRIQKRMLHLLCQQAEEFVPTQLLSEMPSPNAADDFHPYKKCLLSKQGASSVEFCCSGSKGWQSSTTRSET